MKQLHSRCLALFVCLGLLVGFSVTANAKEVTGHEIRHDSYLIYDDGTIRDEIFRTFTPGNGTQEHEAYEFKPCNYNMANNYGINVRTVWNIGFYDQYPFELNKLNRVKLDNFYFAYLVEEVGTYYVRSIGEHEEIYGVVKYTDGSSERLEITATSDSDNTIDMNFEFTPTMNVNEFMIIIDSDVTGHLKGSSNTNQDIQITVYMGEFQGDNKYTFNIEVASEEEKLLGGILGWIQNIFNKVTGTFEKVGEIFDSIKELPVKLWNVIRDGLMNLFVPDSDFMSEWTEDMNLLLADKLGAIYQTFDIGLSVVEIVQQSDETNSIEFPSSTINLPGNNTFTFGGYDIQVVPDGFEWLAVIVKTITGISCVCLAINMAHNKLEEVLAK